MGVEEKGGNRNVVVADIHRGLANKRRKFMKAGEQGLASLTLKSLSRQ